MNHANAELAFPEHFNLLTVSEKEEYLSIRNNLRDRKNKFKRNKRISSIENALSEIHSFVMKGANDDWKKGVVCGLFWMENEIAVNNSQLGLMIDKCKSSINGALAKMGFGTIAVGEAYERLFIAIPILKQNFAEQKRWTIRKRISSSPLPVPAINILSPSVSVSPQLNLLGFDFFFEDDFENLFGVQGNKPQRCVFFDDPFACMQKKWKTNDFQLINDLE